MAKIGLLPCPRRQSDFALFLVISDEQQGATAYRRSIFESTVLPPPITPGPVLPPLDRALLLPVDPFDRGLRLTRIPNGTAHHPPPPPPPHHDALLPRPFPATPRAGASRPRRRGGSRRGRRRGRRTRRGAGPRARPQGGASRRAGGCCGCSRCGSSMGRRRRSTRRCSAASR